MVHLKFTTKYILALTILGCLSIYSYINITTLIQQQSNDSKVINLSGKQRMLSQKIKLAVLTSDIKILNESLKIMEVSHTYLTSLPMSNVINKIYFDKVISFDKEVKEYLKNAKKIKENKQDVNSKYIIQQSNELLKEFDNLTSLYQSESEYKIKQLREESLYVLVLSIFTLLIIGIFIFRPTNCKLEKSRKKLLSEKNYSDIVIESNTNAIIAVGKDLKVKTFNKAAENMFGYTKEEMIGKNSLLKIIPKMFHQAHKEGISNHFKTGLFKHNGANLELDAINKNGDLFPIMISFGEDENLVGNDKIVIANIQDITNIKIMEEERKKQEKIIFQQSKMAAMGEMIENIAHEWRQPLSAISVVSSGLKVKDELNMLKNKDIEVGMDQIINAVNHLSQTIDDFRDFYKIDKKKKVFSINEVIDKTFNLITAQFKSTNITIIKNIEEGIITGYKNELIQVLINILNNARDELINKEQELKLIIIETSVNNGIFKIFIKDNAGGIPDNIIKDIFLSHFTTKEDSDGTGIGLYMSKMIIEENIKGKIEVDNVDFVYENNSYKGAQFKISLPISTNT